jgi:hypothetical protein
MEAELPLKNYLVFRRSVKRIGTGASPRLDFPGPKSAAPTLYSGDMNVFFWTFKILQGNRTIRAKLPQRGRIPPFVRLYIFLFGKNRKILKYFKEISRSCAR